MSNWEVSNPVVVFAEWLNSDICLGSDSGNLVISNASEGKKSPGAPVWPDNQHGGQTGTCLLSLQSSCPVLPYPVQFLARATSGSQSMLTWGSQTALSRRMLIRGWIFLTLSRATTLPNVRELISHRPKGVKLRSTPLHCAWKQFTLWNRKASIPIIL